MNKFYLFTMIVLSLGISPVALHALGTQASQAISPSLEVKEERTSLRVSKGIGAGILSAFCLGCCAAFLKAGINNVTFPYKENGGRLEGTVKGLFVLNCAALLLYTDFRAAGYSFNSMSGRAP